MSRILRKCTLGYFKQVGSNSRKAANEESKAAEEAEKLRKKEEMKKALADDEAALEGVFFF